MAENPEREDAPRRGAAPRAAPLRRPDPPPAAIASGALLLPALGDVLTFYAPPLVVARLLGAFARDGAARPPPSCARTS